MYLHVCMVLLKRFWLLCNSHIKIQLVQRKLLLVFFRTKLYQCTCKTGCNKNILQNSFSYWHAYNTCIYA
jgi:hypothetical protein